MGRYYYDDALAAAWMARHHGMTLYTGHVPDDFDAYSEKNWHHCVDDWRYRQEMLKQEAPKFYINPDSLHLLEPQDKDVGQDQSGEWFEYSGFYKTWNSIATLHDCEVSPDSAVAIRQRNGLAFMWPKEAAE